MAKASSKDVKRQVQQSASKIWHAGLGAFATAQQEGGKVFQKLVDKGKEFEKKRRIEVGDLRERAESLADQARERAAHVAALLDKFA